MIEISYFGGYGSHISPSCYADLVVEDDTGWPHRLVLASLAGDDSSVKAIAAAIAEHREVRVGVPVPGSEYVEWKDLRAEGRHRILTGKTAEGHTHALVFSRRFLAGGDLVLDWQGDLAAALLRWLQETTTLPVLPAWGPLLLEEAQERRMVQPLAIHAARTLTLAAASVPAGEGRWEELLGELVRRGSLAIPEGVGRGEPRAGRLEEYLAAWAPALAERVQGRHRPRYVPEPGAARHPAIAGLARPLYEPQADMAEALARTLAAQRAALLIAEMGSGKSAMGVATAERLFHGRGGYRTLVLAPKHLVYGKWPREVRAEVPGARITLLRRGSDLLKLWERRSEVPRGPEWYFIARDTAKLGYFRRPGARWGEARTPRWAEAEIEGQARRTLIGIERETGWRCPDCGGLIRDKDGNPVPRAWFCAPRADNAACPACGGRLWQADLTRIRRFAPADFIHHHLRGFFDLGLFDEIHQLSGQETAQGNALGSLSASCRYQLGLSGTLLNGYSSSLHALLWRLFPGSMAAEDLDYRRPMQWVQRYGVLERVTRTRREDAASNAMSRGKRDRVNVREKPGTSPLAYSRFLLDAASFMTLDDVAPWLPPYREVPEPIEMDPELASAYRALEGELLDAVRQALAMNSKRLLGAYVQTLLGYPDRPWDWPEIRDPADPERVIAVPRKLAQGLIRAKEQRLISLCEEGVAQGRGTMVFAQYTGRRDILAHLERILAQAGLRVAVLRADTVPVEDREEWIARQEARGAQVLLTNPKLVETGMDLVNWPSACFFQPGYSVFTLRQASRRAWRIGQTQPVHVRFMVYSGSMQSAALLLMSRKLDAAEAIEGRLNSDGLKALASDEDGSLALARLLVEGLGELPTAEAAWRSAAASVAKAPAAAAPSGLHKATLADPTRHTRVVEAVEGRGRRRVFPGQVVLDLDDPLGLR